MVNAMGDESIVETINEDIAEAAKAVVAEIRSLASEVTDAAECAVTACDDEASSKDSGAVVPESKDGEAPR